MSYIHENGEWPNFRWNESKIGLLLAEVRHIQGRLLGRMESIGFDLREEARLVTLTEDVVKTSQIEGERLDVRSVRSSIARRLGLEIGALNPINRDVEGVVEMMLDATGNFEKPLTRERLFAWHAALFPTGRSGMHRIAVGKWRSKQSGAMQVVSGPIGRENVHFEAPSHERLRKEMLHFLKWFNAFTELDLVLKSALAHFWFVTIHPFEDGNGRIARALADLLLARSEGSPQRFYSMSAQIEKERKSYYEILERSQKGSMDITAWIEWYLNCLKRAILVSEQVLEKVLAKTHFWRIHAGEYFNERQRKVINRLLDGFEGKLKSSKWARMTKCSPDTALRDINDLLERKILTREEQGGRSTSYKLNLEGPG
jgi:Fic family protein